VSRTLSTLQAALLGLLLLAGVGLTAAVVLAVGSRKWFWNDSFHVRAGFPSVNGVEVGTKVRVRGMDAGEVVALEVPASTGGQIQLRLRIHDKFRHLVRADASVQIVSVGMLGGKAVEIDPGTEGAPPVDNDALLASRKSTELSDVMDKVQATLDQALKGEGSLGLLARDPKAYEALVEALHSLRGAAGAVQADAEAMKKFPLVGKYVEDVRGLLDRGTGEYNRKWFPESKLFEPGGAVLTSQGRTELTQLGDWLESLLRHSGAELMVVSYAAPNSSPENARKLTQDQSRVVLEYLNERFNTRFSFFKKRSAHFLGLGVQPPLPRQDRKLPAPRVEILVFVPQT